MDRATANKGGPPPGRLLPSATVDLLPALAEPLPRTGVTFVNRGPTRSLGAEVWVEQRLSREASASVSYSWQGEPEIRDADEPFPPDELALPPTHRLKRRADVAVPRLLAGLRDGWSSAVRVSATKRPEQRAGHVRVCGRGRR